MRGVLHEVWLDGKLIGYGRVSVLYDSAAEWENSVRIELIEGHTWGGSVTTMTFEHSGTGMPDRVVIDGLVEARVNYSSWYEVEEWELTVRPGRVDVIDTSKREQARSVIYDELVEERKTAALLQRIDQEVERLAAGADVPAAFIAPEGCSVPQRLVLGMGATVGFLSSDGLELSTDEEDGRLADYYEGSLPAVKSQSFTFELRDMDPDLIQLLYGDDDGDEEDGRDYCN